MRKIRVVLSKLGLDGHERGAQVVAQFLREAGMEVIYLGMYKMPEDIIRAAIDEDADVIGLSILSGEHLTLLEDVAKLRKENGLDDRILMVGGVIPLEDIPMLKEMGVDEIFTAGSMLSDIVKYIEDNCNK